MTTFTSATGTYALKSISYTVPSATEAGKQYTVSVDEQGWRCECKGFSYRNDCSHVRKARDTKDYRPRFRVMPLPATDRARERDMAALASMYA